MEAFEDPSHRGNGPAYHTGKPCCEAGCERPAGTAWSPFWCFECNVVRIKRISKQIYQVSREALKKAKEGK